MLNFCLGGELNLFNNCLPTSTNFCLNVTEKIATNKGVNNYQFNYDLSAGIYVYSIKTRNERISRRMIVAEK